MDLQGGWKSAESFFLNKDKSQKKSVFDCNRLSVKTTGNLVVFFFDAPVDKMGRYLAFTKNTSVELIKSILRVFMKK